MELSRKMCLAKLFLKFLHGTVVPKLLHELLHATLCKSCLVKLFLKLLRGTLELSCKRCLAKLFLKPWHGAVVQKLPCRTFSEAVAWSCPAKVALQSYFLSFCMELSCRGCLSKLFLKLLCESVVEKF